MVYDFDLRFVHNCEILCRSGLIKLIKKIKRKLEVVKIKLTNIIEQFSISNTILFNCLLLMDCH